MTLEDLKIRAEKAVKLQKHMESLFGSHPFYKELAIMAALQDAHYLGKKKGNAEVLKLIPTDTQVANKGFEIYNDGDSVRVFNSGAQFIINKLTEHE
jgi:hypothetical protein